LRIAQVIFWYTNPARAVARRADRLMLRFGDYAQSELVMNTRLIDNRPADRRLFRAIARVAVYL